MNTDTALEINDLPCEVSKIPRWKSWFSFVKISILIFFKKTIFRGTACSLLFKIQGEITIML